VIIWCAYCQQFLGEAAPFENKDFSHGICPSCAKRGLDLTEEQESKMNSLVKLNHRFWEAGRIGNLEEMGRLAKEGIAAGIRPIDMLFGFAGPSLVRVGELWSKNTLTVADEHRFTQTCDAFIDLIGQHIATQLGVAAESQRVLLVNIEGNQHVLGLRFVSLGLAGIGIRFKILLHATLTEAIKTAVTENYQVVGFTIGLPDQVASLKKALNAFLAAPDFLGQILVGGAAVNSGLSTPVQSDRVHLITRPIFNREEWESIFKSKIH
jgi:methanogenic corrinoid protein MtbC1